MKRIKLVWQFMGSDAHQIALHHSRHLEEFSKKRDLSEVKVGVDQLSDNHSVAFLTLRENEAEEVVKFLRPHQVYEDNPQ